MRVTHSAEFIVEGQVYSSITFYIAAKYRISKRISQIYPITYLLLKDDIEGGYLNRPEITSKLICTFETAMHRAMKKTYSSVAINARFFLN